MESASHCQRLFSRNTTLENTNRWMTVKSHTCSFHMHQLHVIISGAFVKHVVHSHLSVIMSATMQPLPLQSLSPINVLGTRSEKSKIWLSAHLARGKGTRFVRCCYIFSPTSLVKKLSIFEVPSTLVARSHTSSKSSYPPCKPRRRQQSSTSLAPQPFP